MNLQRFTRPGTLLVLVLTLGGLTGGIAILKSSSASADVAILPSANPGVGNCTQTIFQADLPIVLTQPGIYCLASSLSYAGLAPAITVQAANALTSGIILDFGGLSLTGAGPLGAQIAIQMQQGADYIIRNGMIVNFYIAI